MSGDELRRLRERLKLTQVALSRLAGIHPNSLARMERGEMRITPAMERLFKLLVKEKH